MRKSLISIFAVMIIAAFISACSVNGGQEGETVNDTEKFVNFSEDETDADNKVTGEAPGAYTILDDPDYTEEINYDYPVVCYNGHDYLQYGNTWSDRDEEWLNENYTYIGEAEYYSDYALGKGDFTTIDWGGGCKIYRCNDEDTFILTLWGDGTIQLFFQNDLSNEEIEAASAATDWKR